MSKNVTIILVIVLSLFALFLTAVLVAGIMLGETDFRRNGQNHVIREENFALDQKKDINIAVSSADVEVILTDEKEMRLVEYSNKKNDETKINIEEDASSISIESKNKGVNFCFIFCMFGRDKSYKIYLPKTYQQNLSVSTVSGDIEFNKNSGHAYRDLNISTTSGDITLNSSIKSTRNVTIKSVSGDIELGDVAANEFTSKTTSGDISGNFVSSNKFACSSVSGEIELDRLKGYGHMSTTSGDISIDQFLLTGNTRMRSVSGEIELYLTAGVDVTIDMSSVSGDKNYPNGNKKLGRGTHQLDLATTSGDMTVRSF